VPKTIHQAGEPRQDGSQRCSRCGLEFFPAGHRDHWPVGDYIEVDEQEGTGLAMTSVPAPAHDEIRLCMSPSSTEANAPQPHRLGDAAE
jgi:hypothetical protein